MPNKKHCILFSNNCLKLNSALNSQIPKQHKILLIYFINKCNYIEYKVTKTIYKQEGSTFNDHYTEKNTLRLGIFTNKVIFYLFFL